MVSTGVGAHLAKVDGASRQSANRRPQRFAMRHRPVVGLTHLGPSNHSCVDQHRKGAWVVMRQRLTSPGKPHSLDATPDQHLKGFDVQSQHR